MDQNYGSQQTADGQLDSLVGFRNDAAHGYEISELLSATELTLLADFILMLCRAIAEFVEFSFWSTCCQIRPHLVFGEITEYFRVPNAYIAKVRAGTVTIGQELLILDHQRCRKIGILSIQDNETDVESFTADKEVELGFTFSAAVGKGAKFVLVDATPNPETFQSDGI